MINIFKSVALWDHVPSAQELRSKLDPGVDSVFTKLPADGDKLAKFLEIIGVKVICNGVTRKRFKSEVLYYVNLDGEYISALPSYDPESVSIAIT